MRNITTGMILMTFLSSFSYGNEEIEIKLFKAAKTNNFCRTITFKGANADIYNEYGQTPLMVAAQHNNSSFIDCLRQAIVDVWMKDNDGKTAVSYLKKPKTKTEEIYSIRTYNALRILEIYQMIRDRAQIVQSEIDLKKGIFNLWIEGASCEEFLVPKDIKCFERDKKDQKGTRHVVYEKDVTRGVPPIFAAIQNNLDVKLLDLLDEGADIELKNKFGTRPLAFSIYQNDTKLIEILLKYGANPNVIDGNGLYTPLTEACVTNKISIVKLLLKYDANVNYQHNKSETALTVAAKGCENFELVRLLLDNGANLDLTDTYGFNIVETLYIHCRNNQQGHEKMLKLIYKYASKKYTNRLGNQKNNLAKESSDEK